MAIKNTLTFCNQDKLVAVKKNLNEQFSLIYRTWGNLASRQYRIPSELIIKELKGAQYEFTNYAQLLTKELRLSTIYDISNLIECDLLPNNNNRTIFIRGFGSALFYRTALNRLLRIDEDIVWASFTSLTPIMQEILPSLLSNYSKSIEEEDPNFIEFHNAITRSFDDILEYFKKRQKFVDFKSW